MRQASDAPRGAKLVERIAPLRIPRYKGVRK
jgi:hypothetical protein